MAQTTKPTASTSHTAAENSLARAGPATASTASPTAEMMRAETSLVISARAKGLVHRFTEQNVGRVTLYSEVGVGGFEFGGLLASAVQLRS
jgi:hypothetical protein